MAFELIKDDKTNGYFLAGSTENFEFVAPTKKIKSMLIEREYGIFVQILLNSNFPFPISKMREYLYSKALKSFFPKYQEIINSKYSSNFDLLLETNKKQEQVNLLKKQSIDPMGLIAFIVNAYEKYGYLYSQYKTSHNHKGLEIEKLPRLFHSDGKNVTRVGESELSDGQLKQAIEQRKVIVAKFIDKDEHWHCFFTTYQSLRREENWQDGTPHFHYISSAFGLSREKVLQELQSKNYKLNNLPHIELSGYN